MTSQLLLVFDNSKTQCMSSLLSLLDSHNVNVVLVLPNCTDRLQPLLDLSVNKAAKDVLPRRLNVPSLFLALTATC